MGAPDCAKSFSGEVRKSELVSLYPLPFCGGNNAICVRPGRSSALLQYWIAIVPPELIRGYSVSVVVVVVVNVPPDPGAMALMKFAASPSTQFPSSTYWVLASVRAYVCI